MRLLFFYNIFVALCVLIFLCSYKQSECEILFYSDYNKIIKFEQESGSSCYNGDWEDVIKKNINYGFGTPLVFFRPDTSKLELTVEYFFQNTDYSKQCSSIIYEWSNSNMYTLYKHRNDTIDMYLDYKKQFQYLLKKFNINDDILYEKKHHKFDKSEYVKEYKETKLDGKTIGIEFMYFFDSTQRRVRLYCDFNWPK